MNHNIEHLIKADYQESMSNIKVFMYHQISDDENMCKKQWHCLHIDTFIEHLKLFEKLGFTPVTFEDYKLAQLGKLVLPKKPVILTFDDGYENIYKLVLPALKNFGMKAVAFVLGDREIRKNLWDQELNYPSFELLSGEQIREMASTVFEIGGHTLHHRMLLGLSKSLLWEEIYESRKNLEQLIGKPVITFSYPYGALDDRVKELVQLAGYEFACSVSTGPSLFGADVYEIPRITIFNNTGYFRMAFRLLTPYEQWIIMRRKIHLLFPRQNDKAGPNYEWGAEFKEKKIEENNVINGSLHSIKP